MFIAFCDDDEVFCVSLEQQIRNNSIQQHRIKIYSNPSTFLFDYEDNRFDLVLLDVEMPGHNGLDIARFIREQADDTPIIFLTNYKEYVFNSFDYSPFHYLLKPISIDKLMEQISRIESQMPKRWKDSLTFFSKSGLIRIPIADIVYLESIKHHVYIHTKKEVCKRQTTLSEILRLCDERIIRTHQSYAVNAIEIIGTKKRYTEVIMPGTPKNIHIPVSVRMYSQFVSALREFDAKYSNIPYR